MTNNSYILLLTTLDTKSGELVSKSLDKNQKDAYVGHWVVIDAINESDGVIVFNPYTNTYQSYTWDEFTATNSVALVVTPVYLSGEHAPEGW